MNITFDILSFTNIIGLIGVFAIIAIDFIPIPVNVKGIVSLVLSSFLMIIQLIEGYFRIQTGSEFYIANIILALLWFIVSLRLAYVLGRIKQK